MRTRNQCDCHCHEPGINVKHMVSCCRPDQEPTCERRVGSKPYWMGIDQWDGGCRCLLTANHEGDCMCEHDLDDAA